MISMHSMNFEMDSTPRRKKKSGQIYFRVLRLDQTNSLNWNNFC